MACQRPGVRREKRHKRCRKSGAVWIAVERPARRNTRRWSDVWGAVVRAGALRAASRERAALPCVARPARQQRPAAPNSDAYPDANSNAHADAHADPKTPAEAQANFDASADLNASADFDTSADLNTSANVAAVSLDVVLSRLARFIVSWTRARYQPAMPAPARAPRPDPRRSARPASPGRHRRPAGSPGSALV